jgi:hypothetical protein
LGQQLKSTAGGDRQGPWGRAEQVIGVRLPRWLPLETGKRVPGTSAATPCHPTWKRLD